MSANEIMRRRAAQVVRALSASLPQGAVRAAFVGGSVARDEVWSTMRGERRVIHSDIDLYVVVGASGDERAVREATARAAASLPREEDGVVFERGVDAGVYREDDLLAQPVRPGTVDLGRCHVWLLGDRSVMEALARALDRPMRREEALYLLENRAWDALEASEQALHARSAEATRWRVPAAKAILDVGAAHLIAEERFAPTRSERLARLRARRPATLSARAMAAIEAAARFAGGSSGEDAGDPAAALDLVAESWLALVPAVVGHASTGDGPKALLAKRCRRGAIAANFRELVRMRRRAGVSLPAAARSGWRFASLSPRTVLRTHALARALSESGRVTAEALAFHSSYVARLASHLGCGTGSLDERARAALRALA